MIAYALKRIGLGLAILATVMLAMFALVFLVPGNPARAVLGPRATPAMIANLTSAWGSTSPTSSRSGASS